MNMNNNNMNNNNKVKGNGVMNHNRAPLADATNKNQSLSQSILNFNLFN